MWRLAILLQKIYNNPDVTFIAAAAGSVTEVPCNDLVTMSAGMGGAALAYGNSPTFLVMQLRLINCARIILRCRKVLQCSCAKNFKFAWTFGRPKMLTQLDKVAH